MSSGQRCLIWDLGLVKGAKGLRHHELVIELSWHGIVRCQQDPRTHRTNWKPSKSWRTHGGRLDGRLSDVTRRQTDQLFRRLPRGEQAALERLEHHQLMTNLHRALRVSRRE